MKITCFIKWNKYVTVLLIVKTFLVSEDGKRYPGYATKARKCVQLSR